MTNELVTEEQLEELRRRFSGGWCLVSRGSSDYIEDMSERTLITRAGRGFLAEYFLDYDYRDRLSGVGNSPTLALESLLAQVEKVMGDLPRVLEVEE
ncbi:MAG: hypothetical protein ACYTEQ_01190 [Planctomycetota bacterium]|jgi:hypothetical protein